MRIHDCMYIYPVVSMVTSIYCSVNNIGPRVYTCLHWHIQHLSGAVFHPPHNIHTCTHASTPGTTARQQLCEKLMQMQEVLHAPSVQRTQSHLAPPTLGLHCAYFPRPQYPLTPSPFFPTNPRTVCGPRASAVLLSHR